MSRSAGLGGWARLAVWSPGSLWDLEARSHVGNCPASV